MSTINNDFEFTGFEDIFYGYNMGESISTKRTRKVTITEITEDSDDWSFIDNDLEDEVVINNENDSEHINTDEIYQLLDEMVQDWKIKLEYIVGDGLKKIRRLTKEKKTCTKYLPGEFSINGQGKINEAKSMIMKDWKIEFNKIINSTQNKLERLANEKVKENEEFYRNKLTFNKKQLINSGKKTYINIDCNTGGGFHNLKELMRELDKLTDPMRHQMPTLCPNNGFPNWSLVKRGCTEIVPSYNTKNWMYNLKNNIKSQDQIIADLYHSITPKENKYQNILENFQISHYNNKKNNKVENDKKTKKEAPISNKRKVIQKSTSTSCIKESQKVNNNNTNLTLSKSASSFNLMEYQAKNGEMHFLVVKRKTKSSENIEAEDIYQDWLKTTEGPVKRKPRTRKLSHKSIRKEIIRQANEEAQPIGPKTYSDMLKKNLKLRDITEPVEDIFEAFRDYVKELNSYIEDDDDSQKSSPIPSPPSIESTNVGTVKVAFNVRKRLGGPCRSVKKNRKIPKKHIAGFLPDSNPNKVVRGSKQAPLTNDEKNENDKTLKRPRKYAVETIFGNWRHNLIETSDDTGKPNYQIEAYFGSWRRNFHEKTPPLKQQSKPKILQPETFFSDWVHNLTDKDSSTFELKRTSSKRQSRKNKKMNAERDTPSSPNFFKKNEMSKDGIPPLKEDHHAQKKKNQKNHRKQKLD